MKRRSPSIFSNGPCSVSNGQPALTHRDGTRQPAVEYSTLIAAPLMATLDQQETYVFGRAIASQILADAMLDNVVFNVACGQFCTDKAFSLDLAMLWCSGQRWCSTASAIYHAVGCNPWNPH